MRPPDPRTPGHTGFPGTARAPGSRRDGLLPAGMLAPAGPQGPGLPPTDRESQKPANRIHPRNSACSVLKKRWREIEWSRAAITKPQEATSDMHRIGEWLLPTVFKIQMQGHWTYWVSRKGKRGAQLLLVREGVGQEMFFPI